MRTYLKQREGSERTMKFADLDNKLRAQLTAGEKTDSESRRAELAAQLRTGIALRDAREGVALTQTELANLMGIAQSAISRIEAGRTNISLAMLRRISLALGVELVVEVGNHRAVVTSAA
jgi:ribosome-binding protein aMBF1 (putative translation factor)